MEYRVSKASTVSIITAFTRHLQSIGIFFSLLSMKYDIEIENAAIWRFLRKKSYILSRGHSVFQTKIFSGGLSLEAIHQRSGSIFRDFFVKTTKES